MSQLTHGSLFAGIGGFDLGFERAGIKTIWQVEIDEYCRRVLARHFPDAERFSDVRECGTSDLHPVDIISGGFPCQDISWAGKGKGIDGERSGLYKEIIRIICGLHPRCVVLENPPALLARGIGRVLGDMARIGYDAEWFCLPASAFRAYHIRRRIFILAYPTGQRLQGSWSFRDVINTTPNPYREAIDVVDAFQRKALPFLCGRHDGLPNGMAESALRAAGNSVVPQVTEWIGRRIVESLAPHTEKGESQ